MGLKQKETALGVQAQPKQYDDKAHCHQRREGIQCFEVCTFCTALHRDVKTKVEKTSGNAIVKAVANKPKTVNKKQAKAEEEQVVEYVPPIPCP